MTSAQLANLQSAKNLAATQLGLTLSERSGWDADTRGQYDKALAAIILAYPDRFDEQTVTTAHATAARSYTAVEDDSYSLATFTDEFVNRGVTIATKVADVGDGVADAVSGIGKGLGNVGAVAKYALPVLAVAALVYVAWPYLQSARAPAPKAA